MWYNNIKDKGKVQIKCTHTLIQKGGHKMLELDKKKALENYKEAKKQYLQNMTSENWVIYCETKKACMLLGVRI